MGRKEMRTEFRFGSLKEKTNVRPMVILEDNIKKDLKVTGVEGCWGWIHAFRVFLIEMQYL